MKIIQLTKNKFAIVDDEDYKRVSALKWQAVLNKKIYYAYHSVGIVLLNGRKSSKHIKMHRFIMGINDSKIQVDHINGNGLDNRKENLRLCTNSQNSKNRKGYSTNTSGFRGVSLDKRKTINPWVAQINECGKRRWLGYFSTAEEAARAFDKAAKEIYGEFHGKLNFE